MKKLFLLFSLFLIVGCEQKDQARHYTEVSAQATQVQPTMPQVDEKTADNPHAGLKIGAALSPEAKANLEKMLAQGQDPHAGIDMSAFGGKDLHVGMNMSDLGGISPDNSSSPYTWVLPKGWKQVSNKGMRLASFILEKQPDLIDCSIVSLGGIAGGLEANLTRWMGQIAIEPSAANLQKLMAGADSLQTQGGLEAKIYDLTSLQEGSANKSMIAAIVTTNDSRVFVKLTGARQEVRQHKDEYLALLKSLSLKK